MTTPPNDKNLSRYFSDVGNNSSGLDREVEAQLSRLVFDGDENARNELVINNLRFVIDVAKEYQGFGLTLLELASAGNLGLLEAAEKYDGEKGFKFITYAVKYVRKYIIQELAGQGAVKKPNFISILNRITKAIKENFEGLTLHNLTDTEVYELSKITNISRNMILIALNYANGGLEKSLDRPIFEEGQNDFYNFLEDIANENPEEELICSDFEQYLENALSSLGDERAVEILSRYYGLNGYEEQTLEQIGDEIGLTRERVRQIRNDNLKKLRKKHGKILADCLLND